MTTDQGSTGEGSASADPGPSIVPALVSDLRSRITAIKDLLSQVSKWEAERDVLQEALVALLTDPDSPPKKRGPGRPRLSDEEKATRKAAREAARAADPDLDRRAAGPAAIEKTAMALARVGRTTQAELTRDTGLHSGTVTHALRALTHEDPPKAMKTGEMFHGSAEWAWQGDPPRATVIDVGVGVHEGRKTA